MLYNHLFKFNSILGLYDLFSVLLKKIENILEDNYIKNNKYIINELNNIYSIMDSNVYYINLHFEKLYSELKDQSNELKNMKIKLNQLDQLSHELKSEVKLLKKKEDIQEKKIQKISQYFKCPISFETMRLPMITKYGYTYDNNNIRNWIKIKHTDPMNRQPLEESQLTINYALKNIMNELNK